LLIALSILKDSMGMKLALGRYGQIMEAMQDGNLKKQMIKMKLSIDEEMMKAREGIWNGVWYGIIMGTWIWGFVLFDTMASVEGWKTGLWVVIPVVICPFAIDYVSHAVSRFRQRQSVENDDETVMAVDNGDRLSENRMGSIYGLSMKGKVWQRNSTSPITKNPILNRDSFIEMRTSALVAPIGGKFIIESA
jgi:hypothetical protein